MWDREFNNGNASADTNSGWYTAGQVAGVGSLVIAGSGAAGVRIFAHGGPGWHVGLELAGQRNLIHLGNHVKYGVHLAIGNVAPKAAWLHIYLQKAAPFFRIWTPK